MEVHATRSKSTVRNDKSKLFLTTAFQVNAAKHRYMFVSIKESSLTASVPLNELITSQGPVSRKSRELFGPEKPVVKLQSSFLEKLIFEPVFI